MRKETKNQGKTKLLPALDYCSFFKQSRQSPFAEKLHNSPFTQLRARRFAVPPHVAHGDLLGIYISFCLDSSGVTASSMPFANCHFVLNYYKLLC
jgi:hypothetical protein